MRGRARLAGWVGVSCLVLVCALIAALGLSTADAAPTADTPVTALQVSARAEFAVISWQGQSATGFRVQVATDPDFAVPEQTIETTKTLVVVTSLTPTTGYHVRVVPVGAEAPAAAADFWTTASSAPALAPSLQLTASQSTTLDSDWSSVLEDAQYELELGTKADLSDSSTLVVDGTSHAFGKVKPDTTYYARVRVAPAANRVAGEWSAVVEGKTPPVEPVVVGTFNVGCYLCKSKRLPAWEKRRNAVAERINSESPDVIGLEELAHTRVRGSGVPQVNDLMNRLDAKYATTTCGTRNSPVCTPARNEVHIVYNTEVLEVVQSGLLRLPTAKGEGVRRWMAWAELRQKNTGKTFLFAAVHLKVGAKRASLRVRQIRAAVSVLRAHGLSKLPAVLVGDFNSNRRAKGGNPPYRAMISSGFVDPLGRGAGKNIVENEVHTRYNSYNWYARRPPRTSNNIDYIFVTPMRVSEYEVCVRVDSRGRVIGTIPSDHTMLKATVWLP